MRNKLIIFSIFICLGSFAPAQETEELSTSDLPTESVLPNVDYPEMVINKNITFTQKWTISGNYSRITDEMFFNNSLFGFRGGYFWNEFSAAGLVFNTWGSGLSDYSKVFELSEAKLQVALAPKPTTQMFLYYEQQYFYGKISLARDFVPQFVFFGRYMVGATQYETQALPHLNYTLGYQTYLGKNFFVELSLGLSIHQVFNPVGLNIRGQQGSVPLPPTPQKTEFPKKIQFSQNLNLSAGLLF